MEDIKDWVDISLKVKLADAEMAEEIANRVVDYGIYIEDYSELEKETMEIAHIDLIEEKLLKKDRENVIIHIYVTNENPEEAIAFLEETYKARGIEYTLQTSAIRQEDWANNWKKYFHQLNIGKKMLICPSWEKAENPENRAVLYLEPGMAFGTGTHSTTCLCMEVLENYVYPDSEVLDVGCGSGILALSALLLGAKKAVGIDIDEKAVKTAKENAKRNSLEMKAEFVEGDLTEKISGKYNLIVANIVADIIVLLCEDIRRLMSDNARLIVSGIIKEREEIVCKAFMLNSLKIIERNEKNGWVSFVLEKENRVKKYKNQAA